MRKTAFVCLVALVTLEARAQLTLTCPTDRFEQCGADWKFDSPAAVTLCADDALTITVASTVTNVAAPRCPKLFSVTRTWRATDTCGNSASCCRGRKMAGRKIPRPV